MNRIVTPVYAIQRFSSHQLAEQAHAADGARGAPRLIRDVRHTGEVMNRRWFSFADLTTGERFRIFHMLRDTTRGLD